MSNKFQFDNVISKLEEAAKAVYTAQETLVRDVTAALNKLNEHILDPNAHGINDPDSYFRKVINDLIQGGISNSTQDGLLIDSLLKSGLISDRLDLDSSKNIASSKALKDVYDYAVNVFNQLKNLSNTVSGHTGNTANPHNVTKDQVGLGNIPNAVSDSVTSASNAQLATSKAVKTAYDMAVSANNNSNTRVLKSGDTMTGNLTINKDLPALVLKDTGVKTTIAPSADQYRNLINIQDTGGVALGNIQAVYLKNKTHGIRIYAQKDVNGAKYSIIGAYVDASGNLYTEASKPPANDNTTKIATTNWVQDTIGTRMKTDVVVATTTKAGMVKPDGTSIKIAADGTISVAVVKVATTTVAGTVIPDGSTITVTTTGKISVNAVTTATANAIVKRNADGTITGTITGNAYWADLAELYCCDEEIFVGEVVTIAKEGNGDICRACGDDYVLGVVSRNPAVLLNLKEKNLPNRYPIARIGIVEILVEGEVHKGDKIGLSSSKGVACVNNEKWFAHAVESKTASGKKLVKCII